MDEKANKFFDLVEQDTLYMDRLLLTLEINKVESKYQKKDKPNLFIKEFDEFGLVKNFSKNKKCKCKFPSPKREFLVDEWDELLTTIQEQPNLFSAIDKMMVIGSIEKKMYAITGQRGKPIFFKYYDEYGIPEGYQMNEEAAKNVKLPPSPS